MSRLPDATTADPRLAARFRRRRIAAGVALVAFLGGLGAAGVTGWRWYTAPTCQATASGDTFAFSPEQTQNAATIAAVAIKRGLPARAITVALATALQESDLRNIDYGDRDSVGLFQQRPSQGWGSAEQILDPVYSAGAFYDELIKVDNYAERPITEVAQAVQRSAYPSAYADHEQQGRALASTLAGHSPAGLACRLADPATPGDARALSADLRAQLGEVATTQEADGGTRVIVHTSSSTRAWTVAEWAMAQADGRGITTIDVADRRWTRGSGRGALTWASTSAEASGTTVVITID